MASAIITEIYSQIMAVCMHIMCVFSVGKKTRTSCIYEEICLLFNKCCPAEQIWILYQLPITVLPDTKIMQYIENECCSSFILPTYNYWGGGDVYGGSKSAKIKCI